MINDLEEKKNCDKSKKENFFSSLYLLHDKKKAKRKCNP